MKKLFFVLVVILLGACSKEKDEKPFCEESATGTVCVENLTSAERLTIYINNAPKGFIDKDQRRCYEFIPEGTVTARMEITSTGAAYGKIWAFSLIACTEQEVLF